MVAAGENHLTMAEIAEELNAMKAASLPIMALNLVSYLRGMVSVACMGRLPRAELAGGALAAGLTNITGYSVLSGLAMGMEPLCSQAFGSRNPTLAARTLRRSVVVLLLASLPIALLWINLHPLLLLLRQDPAVASVAARYSRLALPDLLAASLLLPLRVYLRCRGVLAPIVWCSALALLAHLPLAAALCSSAALGAAGAAIANSATNFNTLFLLIAYSSYARYHHPHPSEDHQEPFLELQAPPPPPQAAAAAEWRQLVRLAVPSCLAVCLEWWWYELMTIASGYIADPRVTLAAAAAVIQTTALMYTLPITLSTAVSARVGNELGAGRPARARLAALVAMGLSVMGSFLGLGLTTLGREKWARVFTRDGEIVELIKKVLPVIGLCELANCPQTTGCGVLRGSARPAVGAAINLYAFYVVGVPVALGVAFGLDLGFLGLCLGLLSAQVVCAVSVAVAILRTDWEREALKAQDLVGRGEFVDEEAEEPEFLKEVDFQG